MLTLLERLQPLQHHELLVRMIVRRRVLFMKLNALHVLSLEPRLLQGKPEPPQPFLRQVPFSEHSNECRHARLGQE